MSYDEIYINREKDRIKTYISKTYNLDLTHLIEIDNYLEINLRNLIVLKIWKEKIVILLNLSAATQYLDEIISNFNQIIVLGIIGFKIPSFMLLRRSIENLVGFLYYKDHPIEFIKKENASEMTRKFISIKDVQDYIIGFPFYMYYESSNSNKCEILIKRIMSQWMEQYKELSNFVHGTNSKYLELNDYLDDVSPSDITLKSLSKSILDFSSLFNTLFILFFFDAYVEFDKQQKSMIRGAICNDHKYKTELINIFSEI